MNTQGVKYKTLEVIRFKEQRDCRKE